MSRHFLYVADPMCSWCYGFFPVVETLARAFEGRLPVKVLTGGLRPFNTQVVRDKDKEFYRNAWGKVGAATGRPFNTAFFQREGFIYDTEPACRAIVTGRALDGSKSLDLAGRISSAFYADNRDVTNAETLADIGAEAGYDRAGFLEVLTSDDARAATVEDFKTAKQMGIEGFPCLLSGDASGYALVTHGYRPIDGMVEAVEGWITKTDASHPAA
jgi:putative protein-disulfide isomerase